MSTSPAPRRLPRRSSSSPQSKQTITYLLIYNTLSLILWFCVLGRVVILIALLGTENVYGGVGQFAKWTQTLAGVEVLNSALGESSVLFVSFCMKGRRRGEEMRGENLMGEAEQGAAAAVERGKTTVCLFVGTGDWEQ